MAFIETLAAACIGGGIFHLLRVPLAWMLGSMTFVMIWGGFSRRKLVWPTRLRNTGLILLGYMMGLPFTLETGQQIVKQLPSMLAATAATMGFTILLGYLLSKLAGISLSTALIGSIPGGLTQMVVLSEEIKGADATAVTFMQTIRVFAVIFIVPFIATHGISDSGGQSAAAGANPAAVGAMALHSLSWHTLLVGVWIALGTWTAVRLRFPTPYLLAPMLTSAMIVMAGLTAPELPQFWILAAQVTVGAHMGLIMKPANLQNWKRLLPYTVLNSVAVVFFSMLIGFVLSWGHPISLLTGFLGTAPGGMTEMGVTATLMHADLSIVVAYQMFRILFILFAVPPVLTWWLKRTAPSANMLERGKRTNGF